MPAQQSDTPTCEPIPEGLLPAGIRSRIVPNINGLDVHIFEAGFETADRELILLLHGFPELAISWRNIMVPLAEAGYHVVAPDMRGYGRTTGWDAAFDTDLSAFWTLNYVRDALGLVFALGYDSVASVVGHDAGSPVAAYCALVRPDVFRSVVMMSAPSPGPPLRLDAADTTAFSATGSYDMDAALAALPRPRKHYVSYYATREANSDMLTAEQGLHDVLRAYFHQKSGDWADNTPHPLAEWTAEVIAELPTYYVMDLHRTMPETVAEHMPDADQIASNEWLPDDVLAYYTQEFARTGFQGGLNGYRLARSALQAAINREVFSGLTIDVPAAFISGAMDWGVFQIPGALDRLQTEFCTQMTDVHLVEGAGHWVAQEKPDVVSDLILDFLSRVPR